MQVCKVITSKLQVQNFLYNLNQGASHILLSRAIVISQMWYHFYVSQPNPLIFGMQGAKWVNKRNLKGFFSQTIFLTIFVHFSTFRPKNRKIAKNGQKNGRRKKSFQIPFINPFCPLHAKNQGIRLRDIETVPHL